MKQSLAVKYRPQSFEEVLGQTSTKQILARQLETNSFSNCYLLCGPSGDGKAQPLDSLVFTENGYVKIGELNVGDRVLNGFGDVVVVRNVFDQGARAIYRISLSDGTSFEVADNHLNTITLSNKENEDQILDLDTLTLKNFLDQHAKKNDIKISIPVYDLKLTCNDYDLISSYTRGVDIVNNQVKHRCIDNRSLYSSYGYREALLAGMLDAGGEIVYGKRKNLFGKANICALLKFSHKQLADDTAHLARTLGCIVRQYQDNEQFPIYYVLINPKDTAMSSLFKKTYNKKMRCMKLNKYANDIQQREIINIEYIGDKECRCIYLDCDDHTYLTNNLTLTHNTTIARILGNRINKGVGSIIEIDGASNNGVDAVRAIIDSAKQRSVDSEYKIFLIDEVHALSSAAWQAFLKCIEEPPAYTIFIFCTTNPEKIPETILNRVMRFNLSRVDTNLIRDRLLFICQQEHYTNYEEACDYIAKLCDGGVRDGIATLEKCGSYSTDLAIDNVIACLGTFSFNTLFDLTGAILNSDEAFVLQTLDSYYNSGNDFKIFLDQYLEFCLDLVKYCLFQDMTLVKIPNSLQARCAGFAQIPDILPLANKLAESVLQIKQTVRSELNNKNIVETLFIKLCRDLQV